MTVFCKVLVLCGMLVLVIQGVEAEESVVIQLGEKNVPIPLVCLKKFSDLWHHVQPEPPIEPSPEQPKPSQHLLNPPENNWKQGPHSLNPPHHHNQSHHHGSHSKNRRPSGHKRRRSKPQRGSNKNSPSSPHGNQQQHKNIPSVAHKNVPPPQHYNISTALMDFPLPHFDEEEIEERCSNARPHKGHKKDPWAHFLNSNASDADLFEDLLFPPKASKKNHTCHRLPGQPPFPLPPFYGCECKPPTKPTLPPTGPTVPPTNPTELPTDPTLPPTEPTVPPTNPTVLPTNPTVPPTDPTLPPTDPSSPPTDPTVPPTNPTVPPTDPTLLPTDPTLSPTEPTVSTTDVSIPPTEPTVPPTNPTLCPTAKPCPPIPPYPCPLPPCPPCDPLSPPLLYPPYLFPQPKMCFCYPYHHLSYNPCQYPLPQHPTLQGSPISSQQKK